MRWAAAYRSYRPAQAASEHRWATLSKCYSIMLRQSACSDRQTRPGGYVVIATPWLEAGCRGWEIRFSGCLVFPPARPGGATGCPILGPRVSVDVLRLLT